MTSQSFQDLSARLAEVASLSQADPARSADFSRTQFSGAVNRASIVLLSAHLEGYLEDVVVEAMDSLVQHSALVENIPRLLRALHVEDHIATMEPVKDRKARAVRIEKLFKAEASWWVHGAVVQATMLRQQTVCSEMSNPGAREVKQFLELVGVDLDAYLRSTGADDLLRQLNGLVGRRNAIAHGEVSAQATYSDVDAYMTLVEGLCSEIDSAIASSVQAICNIAVLPW